MFRYYPTVSLDSFSMIRGDTSSVKGVGLKESLRKKREKRERCRRIERHRLNGERRVTSLRR